MMITKRVCERVYPDRQKVAFGRGEGGWLTPAQITDYSESGICLKVQGVCEAKFGDAIRVTGSACGDSKHARVVRLWGRARGRAPRDQAGLPLDHECRPPRHTSARKRRPVRVAPR
jgi:hypothetical protein